MARLKSTPRYSFALPVNNRNEEIIGKTIMTGSHATNARTIERFMTPTPHVIAADEPIASAQSRLKQYRVRHLPIALGPPWRRNFG